MKKVLFLIHDLGHGGAEKVLVNLVNNMNSEAFEINVLSLFGGGVNEQFLKPHINYHTVFKKSFRGNSHVMKLFSSKLLHKVFVKEHYDIEISYLEGPSARVISGCRDSKTKLVSWIHCTMHSENDIAESFRSYKEAAMCYSQFDRNVFVSAEVRNAFLKYCPVTRAEVRYNTNEKFLLIFLLTIPQVNQTG